MRHAPEIVIYQMGKVGSMSLKRALVPHFKRVRHCHPHKKARAFLRADPQIPKLVMCGVREPLSHSVSAFFQNLTNTPHPHWYVGDEATLAQMAVGDLVDAFDQRLNVHRRQILMRWFLLFSESVGVAQEDLALAGKPYVVVEGRDGLPVMLYKYEHFDTFLAYLRGHPLFEGIDFAPQNVTAEKPVGALYAAFRDRYRMPRALYEAEYGQIPWLRKMYTDSELDAAWRPYVLPPHND